ncbi:hypothetical protein [Haloferula sargassicola]|uniref:Uncharacterized protein n=1 Tax=Haloferula sargassicola TaxID=490096 RepID=A0ABP9UV79_9BACT
MEPPELPPPPPNNAAIGWFRFVLWILPAGMLALWAALLGSLGLRGSDQWLMTAWVLLSVASTYGIGWFDARLSQKRKLLGRSEWSHAAIFVLAQLVVAPAVLVGVLFSICLVAGGSF